MVSKWKEEGWDEGGVLSGVSQGACEGRKHGGSIDGLP